MSCAPTGDIFGVKVGEGGGVGGVIWVFCRVSKPTGCTPGFVGWTLPGDTCGPPRTGSPSFIYIYIIINSLELASGKFFAILGKGGKMKV